MSPEISYNKIRAATAMLGAALAVILWIGSASLLANSNNISIKQLPKMPPAQQPKTHKLRPGKDNSKTASASWISYDAFKNLIADQHKVNQAAFQDKVTPQKQAPMRIKKLSKNINSKTSAKPKQSGKPSPKNNAKQQAEMRKALNKWMQSHISALTKAGLAGRLAKSKSHSGKQRHPSKGKPTSAPKSKSESPAASFIKANHKTQVGKVIAGPGIEIHTAVPDFSAVTLASSIPGPMEVTITFDKSGQVTDATITRSSTYPNFDSAVLSSLYRWRATGKNMKKINHSFVMDFTLLW